MSTTDPSLRPSFASPVLAPGWQSSEFILALLVLATVFAALWAGRIDPVLATTLIGLIVSGYPSLRTWLKAQHLDGVVQVLAAQTSGAHAAALTALAGALATPGASAGIDAAAQPLPGAGGEPQSPSATNPGPGDPRSGKSSIALLFLLSALSATFLSACAHFQTNLANFLVSPGNEAIVSLAVQAGVNSLIASAGSNIPGSVQQPLATTADAAANSITAAFLSSAAAALRTQQGTGQAAIPASIASAVRQAGAPTIAPVVASTVSSIAAAGIPPSAANEAVAVVLDSVAASVAQTPPQAKRCRTAASNSRVCTQKPLKTAAPYLASLRPAHVGHRVLFPGIDPDLPTDSAIPFYQKPLPTLYDNDDQPIYPLLVTRIHN